MRNIFLLLFFFFLAFAVAPAQNLIKNPSFENGAQGRPLHWRSSIINPAITFRWEQDSAHTGDHSVSIEKRGTGLHAYWYQITRVESDKIYTLSSYFMAESGGKGFAIILVFWENGIQLPDAAKVWSGPIENQWRKYKNNFYVPKDIDSVTIAFELNAPSGKIYIDDIELIELSVQEGVIAVNCGAKEPFTESPDGIIYFADRKYSPELGWGYLKSSAPPKNEFGVDLIGGTEGRYELYNKARYDYGEYRFDLENGDYLLTLHFCENEFHWKNKRIQNYQIEDIPALIDFDVFAEAGRSYAVQKKFLTHVNDGRLEIRADTGPGRIMLSAVSIVKVEEETVAPHRPDNFTVVDGFSQNILNWEPNYEKDFLKFKVYRKAGAGFEVIANTVESRFIDDEVEVGKAYLYKISAVDIWGSESEATDVVSAVPLGDEASKLPVFEIIISEENLAKLNDDVYSEDYVQADFLYEGEEWKNVGVRYRGNVTQKLSKKNYKVKFDNERPFGEMEKLNLNAAMNDFSMIIDYLSYSLRRDAGVLTQDVYPVHLKLNGKFIGVYFQREQEDNDFLENHGIGDANIYRSQRGNLERLVQPDDYEFAYEKENNGSSGYDDLIQFIEFLNEGTDDEFKNALPYKFKLGEFLTAYAVLNCVADKDQHFHNFLLINSFSDGKWRVCNWDHNSSFSNSHTAVDLYTSENPSPIGGGINYLFDRMFHIDEFRYYYITKLLELTNGVFSDEEMLFRIYLYYELIKFDSHRDIFKQGWEDNRLFDFGPIARVDFVKNRVEYIQREAPKFLPEGFDPLTKLFINEAQPINTHTFPDENSAYSPWIEIYNDEVIPVSLGGCYLTNDPDEKTLWRFPDDAEVGPKSFVTVFADGGGGTFHASFILDEQDGVIELYSPEEERLDAFSYGAVQADRSAGREEDGGEPIIVFDRPSPGASNSMTSGLARVIINEFMADNETTIADEEGDFDDWIELHNMSSESAYLGGYYLTDELSVPAKWRLPDEAVIGPRGFLLVWADNDPGDGTLHTSNLKLSKDGEEIGLFAPDATTLIDSLTFGPQQSDVSMGRKMDGGPEWILFYIPTPGSSNNVSSVPGVAATDGGLLKQNYPNPVRELTTIEFHNPEYGFVTLKVYDYLGNEMAALVDKRLAPGEYKIGFRPPKTLPQGIYSYRISVNNLSATRSMIVIR